MLHQIPEENKQKYWYVFSLRKGKETLERIDQLLWQKGFKEKVDIFFSSEEFEEVIKSTQIRGGYIFIYCEKISGEFLKFFWSLDGFKGFLFGYDKRGETSPFHLSSSIATSSLFKFREIKNSPPSSLTEQEDRQQEASFVEKQAATRKPLKKTNQFMIDEHVTVKKGPLTGSTGVVTSIIENKDMIVISTNLFGSSVKVTLSAADCEKNF